MYTHIQCQFLRIYQCNNFIYTVNEEKNTQKIDLHFNNMAKVVTSNTAVTRNNVHYDLQSATRRRRCGPVRIVAAWINFEVPIFLTK